MFNFSDHELGEFLLSDLDLDAQMLAVRSLLSRNRKADDALTAEIQELEARAQRTRGDDNLRLVDHWVDEMHGSVFQSAANSLAAAGVLAPLVESLLVELFQNLGKQFGTELPVDMVLIRGLGSDSAALDPHVVFDPGKRRDLAAGYAQLAKLCGLEADLPQDHAVVVAALIAYRNKALHQGFEWPMDERRAFLDNVSRSRWPAEWFPQATHGGEPWVIYMSDSLIRRVVDFIDELIVAAGIRWRALDEKRATVSQTAP